MKLIPRWLVNPIASSSYYSEIPIRPPLPLPNTGTTTTGNVGDRYIGVLLPRGQGVDGASRHGADIHQFVRRHDVTCVYMLDCVCQHSTTYKTDGLFPPFFLTWVELTFFALE